MLGAPDKLTPGATIQNMIAAIELITELERVLDKRGGKDLEVRMDVDCERHHSVCSALLIENLQSGYPDMVCLLSWKAAKESIAGEHPFMPKQGKLH
jgi:hypothetical protein